MRTLIGILSFFVVFAGANASIAGEDSALLLGTWEFGQIPQPNLRVEPQTITWGRCEKMPFRVLRQVGTMYFLEVDAPKNCIWARAEGMYLRLTVDSGGQAMEVRVCASRRELEHLGEGNRGDTYCSWQRAHKL
jgi:hypothetical protein